MRKIITISLTLLSLVSCSKSYNIDVISVKYIEYLNNNIESNDEYNVLVTEIETEDKTVYRMTASNNKLEKDDLPYRYFKYKDRKSTRLNSSHVRISYAVFCLKKKKQ